MRSRSPRPGTSTLRSPWPRSATVAPSSLAYTRSVSRATLSSAGGVIAVKLEFALSLIAHQRRGVLLYLRQEGRGIGLLNKVRAYALQDVGLDTVDANHQLGHEADARDYSVAVAMLHALDVTLVRLLTNKPRKIDAMVEGAHRR